MRILLEINSDDREQVAMIGTAMFENFLDSEEWQLEHYGLNVETLPNMMMRIEGEEMPLGVTFHV